MIIVENLHRFFTATTLVAAAAQLIGYAVAYLLAALGETFGQRSGVLNLGVDGVMLMSAFVGYYVTLKSGNVWLGTAAGVAVGIAMGLLVALVNVSLRAEQGISGIGIFLFGLGLSDLLFEKFVGTPTPIKTYPRLDIPLLADIPQLGKMLFRQNLVVYVAFLAVPVAAFVLQRTTFGLDLRSVGENPQAADSLGISVVKVRYQAQVISGALCGLAGASLTISLQIFQQNLTSGLGFIAIALVYFGAWRPVGVMLGALLYGAVQSLVLNWQSLQIIPDRFSDFWGMAPALVTILVLVFVAQRARQPAALTKPFTRGA